MPMLVLLLHQDWVHKVANLGFAQEVEHLLHDKADHPLHEVEVEDKPEVEDSDYSSEDRTSDEYMNTWETYNKI